MIHLWLGILKWGNGKAISHLWMMFLSKPPFVGRDLTAKLDETGGYTGTNLHMNPEGRFLPKKTDFTTGPCLFQSFGHSFWPYMFIDCPMVDNGNVGDG